MKKVFKYETASWNLNMVKLEYHFSRYIEILWQKKHGNERSKTIIEIVFLVLRPRETVRLKALILARPLVALDWSEAV